MFAGLTPQFTSQLWIIAADSHNNLMCSFVAYIILNAFYKKGHYLTYLYQYKFKYILYHICVYKYHLYHHIQLNICFSICKWGRHVFMNNLWTFLSTTSSFLTFHSSRPLLTTSLHLFLCGSWDKLQPNSNIWHQCIIYTYTYMYHIICKIWHARYICIT